MNNLKLSETYWASVSGGKDSLYMLAHILNNLDIYPLDGVVHFELEIDYPFIKEVIDYMESECIKHNIPFLRIKPRKTFIELYNKNGFPTRKVRWCNSKYKLDCKKQLNKIMKSQNKKVVYYIGICANETSRIKDTKDVIYPLVELGIYENTIWEWAKYQKIFNDYYVYNRRCGCMYCPLQSMQNTKYLSVFYPNEYNKLMNMAFRTEKTLEIKLGRKFSVWASNPKYDTIYRNNKIYSMDLKPLDKF